MQDRDARKNIRRSVPVTERANPKFGVPATFGEPLNRGDQGFGERAPYYPVTTKKAEAKVRCAGLSGPCKAWPIKDDTLCVGHARQRDNEND